MTEEIIVNEETVNEIKEEINGKAGKFSLPGRSFRLKKRNRKKTGDMSRLDLTLITVTGFLAFCGLVFCAVMIPLFRSIAY